MTDRQAATPMDEGVKHHLETLMPNSNHAGKAGSGDKTVETATENDTKKEKRKRGPPLKQKDETWTPNIYYFIYEPDSDLRSDGTLQRVFPGSTSTIKKQTNSLHILLLWLTLAS